MTLIGSIIPSIYLLLTSYGIYESNFMTNLVSDTAFANGNIYTICATVILWIVAYNGKPKLEKKRRTDNEISFKRYSGILFMYALLSLLLNLSLSAIYGSTASNLTASRPLLVVYIGYLAMSLSPAIYLLLFGQLILYGKLNRKAVLIVILFFFNFALVGSRSGLVYISFFYMISLAYSSKAQLISIKYWIIIIVIGVATVYLGQYIRILTAYHGQLDLHTMMYRFYSNNAVLYFAMSDWDKINYILMVGQPWVMFHQMFSFVIERTMMPSSFRLLEFWGAEVSVSERGHITGYVYGWLGLTYGLFKWYGLIAIYLFFRTIFYFLNRITKELTFYNLILFVLAAQILLEFFFNLGLDSFVEKIFKLTLYHIIFYITIKLNISFVSHAVRN